MDCEQDIQILSFPEKRQVRTRGLEESSRFEFEQRELCVTYGADNRLEQAEFFMGFMVGYVVEHATRPILDGSQVAYGTWQTKTLLDDPVDGFLNFWDWHEEVDDFLPEVSYGLDLWEAQKRVCGEVEASFVPPWGGQTVVTTPFPDGVENPDFAMWRLTPHDDFSGWWLNYRDTVRELGYEGEQAEPDDCITEHIRHFKVTDEGLLPYLALAPGHVVRRTDGNYHVEWVAPEEREG